MIQNVTNYCIGVGNNVGMDGLQKVSSYGCSVLVHDMDQIINIFKTYLSFLHLLQFIFFMLWNIFSLIQKKPLQRTSNIRFSNPRSARDVGSNYYKISSEGMNTSVF